MKKIRLFLLIAGIVLAACDLQPKIVALPDTVGEFITSRYPALLADPTAQPEIYNSAATDYGVYAAPEIYGTGTTTDDYVLYASVDDYIVPPEDSSETPAEPIDNATDEPEKPNVDDTLVVGDRVVEPEPATEPQPEPEPEWAQTDDVLDIPKYMYGGHDETEITVARGDTLYAIGAKYGMKVKEIAKLNNLAEPYNLSVGQKLHVRASREQVVIEIPKIPEQKPVAKEAPKPIVQETPKPTPRATTTRVDLTDVTVAPGDTLYSLSRKYSVPVNDLAVMNNLSAPFALYAGQVVRVPNLADAPVRTATTAKPTTATTRTTKPTTESTKPVAKTEVKPDKPKKAESKTETKKSDTKKTEQTKKPAEQKKAEEKKSVNKLPEIKARSSSKFSWPVRGKILSNYGSKPRGLFNDGINIGAARGTTVAAAENGVIAYAGNEVKGMGNLVIIQHSDGWMTVYAHMDSLAVRRGARVGVGQKIGTVGQSGKVDKPQLHFEIRRGTRAYNPIQYLKK